MKTKALILNLFLLSSSLSVHAGVGDLIVKMKGLLRPKAAQSVELARAANTLVFSEKSKKFISDFGQDLTARAQADSGFGLLQGRQDEIKQMVTTLLTTGDVPNNVLLQGPSGSGKTVLIQHLAHLIATKSEQVPAALHEYRIIEIDVNSFTQKSMQEQLSSLREFINENPKLILFFDEMHTLTEVSKNGARENWVQNMLPILLGTSLERRAPFIGATMDSSVTKLTSIEGLPRRIQTLNFTPVSRGEAFIILNKEALKIQQQLGVYISPEVLQDALVLSARFNMNLAEPGATKELINKVASGVKLYGSSLQNRIAEINQKINLLHSQQSLLKIKKGPLYQKQTQDVAHQIKRQMQLKRATENRLQKALMNNTKLREIISTYIQYQTKVSTWQSDIISNKALNFRDIRQLFSTWNPEMVSKLSSELQQDFKVLAQADRLEPELFVAFENFKEFFNEQIKMLKIQVNREGLHEQTWMTTEDLIKYISKQNNINQEVIASALGEGRKMVGNFELLTHESVFEQSLMTEVLTSHLFRISKNRQSPNHAAGRFLFVGSSGTGKTLAAQTLSASLFNREIKVFDMSAYQDSFSKSKLVGSPAGYVGYDAEPDLFKQLRLFPDSVIVFDNIELAHPDVVRVLESMLNQKIFKSASDLFSVDLSRSIFVITSRLGEDIHLNSSWSVQQKQNHIKTQLFQKHSQTFSPSLMGQLDGVIKFEALSQQGLGHLISKLWKSRQSQLRASQEIDVEISPDVFRHIFSQPISSAEELTSILDNLEYAVLKNDPPKGAVIDVTMLNGQIHVGPALSIYQASHPEQLRNAWILRERLMSNKEWINNLPAESNFSRLRQNGSIDSDDQPLFDANAISKLNELRKGNTHIPANTLPTQTQPVRQ